MRHYIIAGNFHQFANYKAKKLADPTCDDLTTHTYTYVSSVETLRGVDNPHGYFIGTWYERNDIVQVVEELLIRSHLYNQHLIDIHLSLGGKNL